MPRAVRHLSAESFQCKLLEIKKCFRPTTPNYSGRPSVVLHIPSHAGSIIVIFHGDSGSLSALLFYERHFELLLLLLWL